MASLDDINSTQQQGVKYIGLLIQAIKAVFPQMGATSSSATGGAATLPANPVGFIAITLPDGTLAKVPYYAD